MGGVLILNRKQKKELRRHLSTRQLMGIDQSTEHGLKTAKGELVFFLLSPDNLSVLSSDGVRNRVRALTELLQGLNAAELLALALRSYPATTEELALLCHLGEKSGVALHVYIRQAAAGEEDAIIHNAQNKNRMDRGNTNNMRRSITAEVNLWNQSCGMLKTRATMMPRRLFASAPGSASISPS